MKNWPIPPNWLAGLIVTLLVAAAAAVPLVGRLQADEDAVMLHAEMAETGGWTPANLQAQVGQPLHLRLTSDDVMHSFAVGQSDMDPVDVYPGEVSEITLTFDQPGKYTFYCTRWCGENHWRMRGTIEVTGPGQAQPTQPPPLYVTLNLDIDAPHPAAVTPAARPSAGEGARLLGEQSLPAEVTTQEYYRTHSPAEAWQALRAEPSLQSLSDQQVWDLVAALVQAQASPQMLAEGQRLYAENCAACHGEDGRGDGVMAASLAGEEPAAENGSMDMPAMPGTPPDSGPGFGHSTTGPVDFTDPESLLGASPAVLHGKIVRGGMGTGMPYWGPIFTEDQIWSLVAYIQSFQLDLEARP